jgi:SAM-dependent methyltransferase
MAHPQQLMFVSILDELFIQENKSKIRVLEIGSYDVSGTVRQFFNGCDYTGCDLIEGPGVDVVSSGHDLNLPTDSYDITLSSECFEHNPYWVETFQNMHRMTKPGGLVMFTCASRGRVEHGTERTTIEKSMSPGTAAIGWNYYRNLNQSDFEKKITFGDLFDQWFFHYMPTSCDLYFCGRKHGSSIFDFDKKKIASRVRDIKAIPVHQGISKPKIILMKIHGLPILIMSYLVDDMTFQNWRIKYLDGIRPLTNLMKKIVR